MLYYLTTLAFSLEEGCRLLLFARPLSSLIRLTLFRNSITGIHSTARHVVNWSRGIAADLSSTAELGGDGVKKIFGQI